MLVTIIDVASGGHRENMRHVVNGSIDLVLKGIGVSGFLVGVELTGVHVVARGCSGRKLKLLEVTLNKAVVHCGDKCRNIKRFDKLFQI